MKKKIGSVSIALSISLLAILIQSSSQVSFAEEEGAALENSQSIKTTEPPSSYSEGIIERIDEAHQNFNCLHCSKKLLKATTDTNYNKWLFDCVCYSPFLLIPPFLGGMVSCLFITETCTPVNFIYLAGATAGLEGLTCCSIIAASAPPLPDTDETQTHLKITASNLKRIIETQAPFCTVCQTQGQSPEIVMTPCKHKFHKNCYEELIDREGKRCPNCAAQIPHQEGDRIQIYRCELTSNSSISR